MGPAPLSRVSINVAGPLPGQLMATGGVLHHLSVDLAWHQDGLLLAFSLFNEEGALRTETG